jgi:hypothetical protein
MPKKDLEDEEYKDPAEAHPWKRYIIRRFTTVFLIFLAIIIPGVVFVLVSILAGLSTEIGITLAFVSFILYVYLFVKLELWNKVKR